MIILGIDGGINSVGLAFGTIKDNRLLNIETCHYKTHPSPKGTKWFKGMCDRVNEIRDYFKGLRDKKIDQVAYVERYDPRPLYAKGGKKQHSSGKAVISSVTAFVTIYETCLHNGWLPEWVANKDWRGGRNDGIVMRDAEVLIGHINKLPISMIDITQDEADAVGILMYGCNKLGVKI